MVCRLFPLEWGFSVNIQTRVRSAVKLRMGTRKGTVPFSLRENWDSPQRLTPEDQYISMLLTTPPPEALDA